MKIILMLFPVLFSSSAFATMSQPLAPGVTMPPGVNVYYHSWCERNILVFDPNLGSRRPDSVRCIQYSKVCVQTERRVSANQIIVQASCEYGSNPLGR